MSGQFRGRPRWPAPLADPPIAPQPTHTRLRRANFAHGRHHWLAKRSDTTAVIAFITCNDRPLAEDTLDLIPRDVPKARILFDGRPSSVALASLVAALRITGWAGPARGIDPGQPGVPEFGRRIYRLRPQPPRSPAAASPPLTSREAAAIARKAASTPEHLAASGQLSPWREAFADFLRRLRDAHFAGIVLDYDGTVVDTRYRSASPTIPVISHLARLADAGAYIAIATGRGKSVRRHFQEHLPRVLWPLVLLGYYNGAEVASLDDTGVPDGSNTVCDALRPLAEALRRQPELAERAHQEDRPFQITIHPTPAPALPLKRLWELARQVIATSGVHGVTVTTSGHSVDILAAGVSKLNVLHRLRETVADAPVLTIGDRGRWPGNDHELLSEPLALGVDELNADPTTCWHVGAPGQRGPAVTLEYLSLIGTHHGHLRFPPRSLR